MNNYTTVVGLDVHKETIVAAILPYGHKDVTEKVSIENLECAPKTEQISRLD